MDYSTKTTRYVLVNIELLENILYFYNFFISLIYERRTCRDKSSGDRVVYRV